MGRLTKAQKAERDEALATLRSELKPGQTVYAVFRHVSRSGMMRHFDFYLRTDTGMRCISWLIATACDYRTTDRGAIKVGGCGFDAAFDVVYNLGHAVWPKGTPAPHGTRNGEPDSDGGYALRKETL